MKSRQLRAPRNVVVVGGDLVEAAREIGREEGKSEGFKDGLAYAIKVLKERGQTHITIQPGDVVRQLREEMNRR